MADLRSYIRDIPDFPKKGINFKDITTLLHNPEALKSAIDAMAEKVRDIPFDVIIGAEARGFIFGAALAYTMGKGFVPVRKPGKLPAETLAHTYDLEYGTDTLEIHRDALKPGDKVLVVDDLLATGGTVEAVCAMVEELQAEVAALVFLIELPFLQGRDKLPGKIIHSLISYHAE